MGFDFEQPIEEAEAALAEAEKALEQNEPEAGTRVEEARTRLNEVRRQVYANLSAWDRVLFARHKDRPRALDYIEAMTTEFVELHGDRAFGDDKAVVTGFARFQGEAVAVIGQQKGKDTRENVQRNFGMMHPEGYRKALRVMQLADKYGMPIVIFVDTPGAFPGLGAEERGQAEAIARNIQEMAGLKVPIVMIVIGEGASGGALGVGVADRVLMMENAWYCVISPEGCAAILWKDGGHSARAAEALRLTAADLLGLGVIDEIVPEPLGGAHRHPGETIANAAEAIGRHLVQLRALDTDEMLELRFEKFRRMGSSAIEHSAAKA